MVKDSHSKNIQALRGLAIIAVVLIHNTPNGIAQVICRPFLNFAVGLFLFLSGMLSNAKSRNTKNRIKKVIIPYIIWTFIYIVLHNLNNIKEIPISYIKALMSGNAAAIMYYIFVYCEFTLLLPLIDKLARSRYKYWGFIISPLEIIIMRMMPMIWGYDLNKEISIIMNISCLGWFSYYYLGYMVGNNILIVKNGLTKKITILSIVLLLQVFEGYLYYRIGEANCGTQLKLSAVFTGILICLISYELIYTNWLYKFNFLILLGNHSFGIYFSHLAVMSLISKIPYYTKYVVYPINGICVVLISLFCVIVGKKILGKYSKYMAL